MCHEKVDKQYVMYYVYVASAAPVDIRARHVFVVHALLALLLFIQTFASHATRQKEN